MKEIKLKVVWKNKIYEIEGINFIHNLVHVSGKGAPLPLSDVEIIQYTGLNDKNGTEIYEGDILRGKFASGHGGKSTRYKEFNVQVKYSAPEFTITFHGDYNYRFYPQWDECEVIGNVYQDPELLEN